MNITILNVTVTTVPTAKGSYQVADVAFKNNSFGGKVEGKKVMSFGVTKDSFTTLSTAQPGETFDVNVVKNDKGYNDWVSMSKGGAATVQPGQTSASTSGYVQPARAGTTNAAPARSNFETPEERAQRQVYIIRQSSLSAAVATLSVGAKKLEPTDVIKQAEQYTNFVLGKADAGASGFEDLPDFDQPQVD